MCNGSIVRSLPSPNRHLVCILYTASIVDTRFRRDCIHGTSDMDSAGSMLCRLHRLMRHFLVDTHLGFHCFRRRFQRLTIHSCTHWVGASRRQVKMVWSLYISHSFPCPTRPGLQRTSNSTICIACSYCSQSSLDRKRFLELSLRIACRSQNPYSGYQWRPTNHPDRTESMVRLRQGECSRKEGHWYSLPSRAYSIRSSRLQCILVARCYMRSHGRWLGMGHRFLKRRHSSGLSQRGWFFSLVLMFFNLYCNSIEIPAYKFRASLILWSDWFWF